MNAVERMAQRLPAEAVRRLAALRVNRFDKSAERRTRSSAEGDAEVIDMPAIAARLDNDEARARVIERWGGDLCGLLNALTKGELGILARSFGVETTHAGEAAAFDVDDARSWELRRILWERGAGIERGGADIAPGLQPVPVILGGHLVIQAPPRGAFPPSAVWPRPLPSRALPTPPTDEPESLDDLLAAADRAIGVWLGPRGRDKGAWGSRAQALLGVVDRGDQEPDWRGDVEIKTVPIARDAGGLWRVVEDPAIAMVGEGTMAKLQRTLWLARVSLEGEGGEPDATIVSWYLLEWDADVARLARRFLHVRPKGPRGSDARGHYLSKRFFAECGLLASLNGVG
ncbi:MAG: hypothetical protein ABI867_32515 [Kofleriaceae bacterium]